MGSNQPNGAKSSLFAPSAPKGNARLQLENLHRVQNALVIWLDSNINENDYDYRNTISRLRCTVNNVRPFADSDRGLSYLETLSDSKAFMIVSGTLGQQLVSRVHPMPQVDSIFIFCSDTSQHEEWVKYWPKIKGVANEINPICDSLRQAADQCEQNATPMSFVVPGNTFDQLDPTFMYTEIFKEILLDIEFDDKHRMKFIKYCRETFAGNTTELNNINLFDREYASHSPVWWYTCNSFLFPMLNRALRLMDGDLMLQMGFFITDLHRHIERLYKEQCALSSAVPTTFVVHRGQGLSKGDLEQLRATIGGLLSFNSFLSTSRNREISLRFAQKAATNPDLVGVLFVMHINRATSKTPFASVDNFSQYKNEKEVLFSMHSVFRVHDVQPMPDNAQMYEVSLTLTCDEDKDLCALTDYMRKERCSNGNAWERLASVLKEIGYGEKAEEIYNTLLKQTKEKPDKARLYSQLGSIRYGRGQYQQAIRFYEKALVKYRKTPPTSRVDLAKTYSSLGIVYDIAGDPTKALACFEKDLEISEEELPGNSPDLAASYTIIGNAHRSNGDYAQARAFYEKALLIQEQALPANHPDLAVTNCNLGIVFRKTAEYPTALTFHEKALAARLQSLPRNHPHLAASYTSIGLVYYDMGEHARALTYFEKDLVISQQSLSADHPDLATSYANIGMVHEAMENCSKAYEYYSRALDIGQKAWPAKHRNVEGLKMNFDRVRKKL